MHDPPERNSCMRPRPRLAAGRSRWPTSTRCCWSSSHPAEDVLAVAAQNRWPPGNCGACSATSAWRCYVRPKTRRCCCSPASAPPRPGPAGPRPCAPARGHRGAGTRGSGDGTGPPLARHGDPGPRLPAERHLAARRGCWQRAACRVRRRPSPASAGIRMSGIRSPKDGDRPDALPRPGDRCGHGPAAAAAPRRAVELRSGRDPWLVWRRMDEISPAATGSPTWKKGRTAGGCGHPPAGPAEASGARQARAADERDGEGGRRRDGPGSSSRRSRLSRAPPRCGSHVRPQHPDHSSWTSALVRHGKVPLTV